MKPSPIDTTVVTDRQMRTIMAVTGPPKRRRKRMTTKIKAWGASVGSVQFAEENQKGRKRDWKHLLVDLFTERSLLPTLVGELVLMLWDGRKLKYQSSLALSKFCSHQSITIKDVGGRKLAIH